MLPEIKQLIDNPEDVPNVPRGVKKYLQASFTLEYLDGVGEIDRLKRLGYSEQVILGFILGLKYASNSLDDIDARKDALKEGD